MKPATSGSAQPVLTVRHSPADGRSPCPTPKKDEIVGDSRKTHSDNFLIVGSAPRDALVVPEALCSISGRDAVLLVNGQLRHIELLNHTVDSTKRTAAWPLRLPSSFISTVEVGGGMVRTAQAVAAAKTGTGLPVNIRLLNEGDEYPELAAACARIGMEHLPLGRMATPTNAIVQQIPDRVIIKERPIRNRQGPLSETELDLVRRATGQAAVVALVSPKDPDLARAVLDMTEATLRVLNATGGLTCETTANLAPWFSHVIINFSELLAFAAGMGIHTGVFCEDDPRAPLAVSDMLAGLRAIGVTMPTVVITLGRRGVVVADEDGVNFCEIIIHDPKAEVPTPAGSGDMFLGAFLYLTMAWGNSGCLRYPGIDTSKRAMHFVAHRLGLDRRDYDIDVTAIRESRRLLPILGGVKPEHRAKNGQALGTGGMDSSAA